MKKTILWRGLAAVFAVLTAVAIFLTVLCGTWEGYINIALGIRPPIRVSSSEYMAYKTDYSEDGTLSDAALEKMLVASDAHDRQTMEEGAVLVKNDGNTLPLAANERKVTLFGRAVADPVYRGNSGGAGRDPARLVSLYDALKAKKFSINDTLYSAYANSETRRSPNDKTTAWGIGEESASFYSPQLKASYENDFNDAAIVMFSRTGGEGRDLPRDYNGKSILALQSEEADLLEMIKASGRFGKTIVLVNSAYPMELGFVNDEKYGVDACLWIGGPGLKGFTGVASILVGEADPSGHSVDTYAADSLSAPAVRNFGDMKYTNASSINADGAQAYVIQAEDIYVGYKYYETRYYDQVLGLSNATSEKGAYASDSGWNYAEEMAYPFGYGTSYANFTQTLESVVWDRTKHTVTASVKVKNEGVPQGSNYNGKSKSVVQLYVSLPWEHGQAEKSAIQLVDFGKTKLLGKGEEDTVTIVADDYLFATYDEKATNGADATKKGCYVFDEGDYFFAIGDDSHDALNNVLKAKDQTGMFDHNGASVVGDAAKTHKEHLDETDNTSHARSATGEIVCNKVQYADINSYGDFVTYLTRGDWNTYPETYDSIAATAEMIKDLIGEDYSKASNAPTYKSSDVGVEKGIKLYDMKDVAYDDDEKWNEFLRQMSLAELCSVIGEKFGQPAISLIGKDHNSNSDGPSGPQGSYQFGAKGAATQHVNEVVAASTWNKEILRDRGKFIGEDCLFVGTTQLWGPGANLHRTPFSGRNFEYYSEDSIMSYLCGAVQVEAMQAKGVNTAIKHFCANDQETNRTGLSTFMTEQTYRQGALKGFEGGLTKGGALSFMMAMPRIGCKIMYENKETLTDIVRKEWGFKGVNITDSAISQTAFSTIESLMAGTDTFNADEGRGPEVQKYIVTKKDGAVLNRVLEVNKSFYYSMIRSNNFNGNSPDMVVTEFVPWWKPALIVICSVLGVATAAFVVMFVLSKILGRKKETAEKGGSEA